MRRAVSGLEIPCDSSFTCLGAHTFTYVPCLAIKRRRARCEDGAKRMCYRRGASPPTAGGAPRHSAGRLEVYGWSGCGPAVPPVLLRRIFWRSGAPDRTPAFRRRVRLRGRQYEKSRSHRNRESMYPPPTAALVPTLRPDVPAGEPAGRAPIFATGRRYYIARAELSGPRDSECRMR